MSPMDVWFTLKSINFCYIIISLTGFENNGKERIDFIKEEISN